MSALRSWLAPVISGTVSGRTTDAFKYFFREGPPIPARHGFSVDIPHETIPPVAEPQEAMSKEKIDVLQGTLDLLVLQTLATMGPLHGYGIARRIEQVGGDTVMLNQGTIYAALVRLQQGKWISAEWGTSDNNRRAKFYALTARGRKRLVAETENWQRMSGVVHRVLSAPPDGAVLP
jgi:PadR family transcriptional regulator, regulatory protein PadR